MFINLLLQDICKMANYLTPKYTEVYMSGGSGGHIATFNCTEIEFELQPCDYCGLNITTGYWDNGFCNCGEMELPDYTGDYTGDEITTFCSFLELGRTYNVSFADYFDSKYIPHKLTNLFNIVKTGDSDNDDQEWTFIGQGLT